MLTELRVRNLAIAEDVVFAPGPGLNIISGETGAGKSVLVGAIELLFGGRGGPDLIRTGADQARVDGLFHIGDEGILRARGLDLRLPDGALLLTRELSRGGRPRVLVNDELATVTRLKAIGEALADLHGQHEHQALLHPETHVDYLDRFGVAAAAAGAAVIPAYREARERYLELARRRRELAARQGNAEERRARLTHAVAEIEAAGLKAGEEAALQAERGILVHAEKLLSAVGQASDDLSEGDASIEVRVGHAARMLVQAAALDPALEPVARALEEALVGLQEAGRELARYRERLSFEPDRAEWIETRLSLIERLRRRYGGSEAEIVERGAALRAELEGMADEAAELAALDRTVEEAGRAALEAGRALSTWRDTAARRLEKGVRLELGALGMARAGLQVRMEIQEEAGGIPEGDRQVALAEKGIDRVEFFLEANPGEEPRPLARVASGGELSRVMLALKAVLRAADPLPILVFDEVDAGIGGRVAAEVGERLKEIARGRQVFVITHLPMIACHGDRHFRVVKSVRKGRTVLAVEEVTGRDREEELARMLAGAEVGPEAIRAARALLEEARKSF